ncbi:3'-5' exonuclease domain-containing protein [Aphelenchoides besseyi]|nr:3'-5' exonuclease domain-containing protein [Aphelenchoides besseyi]KAI6201521.1 3'-5' exonuclease domain-containing protein [Aphelenchoides besseyi]
MNAFIKNFKDYQQIDRTPAFYQKAIHTMGPSRRGRIAGLSFLAQNSAHETALILAAHMDFPPEKWPSTLFYNNVEFEQIRKKIRDDPELCPKILGPNSTTQLKLAVIAELILGWHLDKGEQASVWGGFRPLRRLQQRYAAQDAFAVVELGKKLEHKIKLDFPHKLQIVFGPFVWQKDRGVVPNFLKEVSNSRKTKCSQFTDQELWTVVRNVNATLVERQQPVIRSAQAIYIADQNCAQIGFTLRRIGINVTVGENPEQIVKFMDMHLSAKILSTGKACKRYSYDNRVLNVPTSHSLDVQLSWILTEEKLYIVSNEIRPRCISCNGQKMVYIPHCVMKYLHNQLAVEKSLNWNVSIEEIVHVEKEMSAIDSFASPNQFVALARGDFGLTITINKTLVFLDTVMMCPPRARPSDPERMIKLRLALHRNIFKEPNKTARPSAVCLTCGNENHYTSSA